MPRSRDKTRQQILHAAYVLFRQRGFTRVNVDEIAAAAKITKRTLYSHFKSKDTLLADVLEAQHGLTFSAFQTIGKKLAGRRKRLLKRFSANSIFGLPSRGGRVRASPVWWWSWPICPATPHGKSPGGTRRFWKVILPTYSGKLAWPNRESWRESCGFWLKEPWC